MKSGAAALFSQVKELVRHPGFRRQPFAVAGRVMLWGLHCLLGRNAKAKFRRWDFELSLPPIWRGGGATSPYLFREHYEPELILLEEFLDDSGMVFVDAGANTGAFSFVAARLVGAKGRVLAFEPGRVSFEALLRSDRLNSFSNIRFHQLALGDTCGTVRLYHHDNKPNSFGLAGADAPDLPFEEVGITTLEQALNDEGLERLDFLKMDVEGAHELILRGAESIIEKCRPTVLIEIHSDACRRLGLKPEGAWECLKELGYSFFQVDGNRTMVPQSRWQPMRSLLAVAPERLKA